MPSSHGMGGLSAVYHDFFETNLDNPASLGFLQYTSLQVGLFAKQSTFKRFDSKSNIWSGNLDHLSLNIPLINPLNEQLERRETTFSWGTAVSLRPYSQVGYSVELEENDPSDSLGTIQRNFRGEGGIYQFAWSHGLKYKNLAAGVNLNYLFGRQEFNEEVEFVDIENSYVNLFQNSQQYKGFQYRLGLMYEHPLDLEKARANNDEPSRLLSVGAYYTGQANIDSKSGISNLAFNQAISDLDTVLLVKDIAGEMTLPSMFGFGLMYRRAGDFRVGLDYQIANWDNYRNTARTDDTLRYTTRFAAGVSWIPDSDAITSYWKRVEYRAGFYTKTDPRVIDDVQVKETAITFGATLPLIMQRNIAWFQVGFDVGTRKATDNLTDNFVRGKVGLVFNDNSWFIRGKYK
jgi:hypothetical protein